MDKDYACPTLFSKKPEMPTDLQKLARAVAQIKKSASAHGKRYSTVVENPFESGYWPPTKPTKRDFAVTLRLRKKHAAAVAASR